MRKTKTQKYSHKEYLDKVYELNQAYREGKFEIIGEYEGSKSKILIQDAFGICCVNAGSLFWGMCPTIKSAVDKNSYYINKAKKVHGDKYDYSKTVFISDKILVVITCPIHGDFEQFSSAHLQGHGCKKCGSIKRVKGRAISVETFIQRANEVHKFRYDYSLVDYNPQNKISIICKLHGIFNQEIHTHLKGHGCKLCASMETGRAMCKDTEYFIKKANEIHKSKYDYSLVDYKNSYEKVNIICNIHGLFKQRPHNHLNKQGCPLCAKETNNFHKPQWVKAANDRAATFYVLKCYNESELFYKIGITYHTIKRRYNAAKTMPYAYEIIKEVIDFDKERIWELEKDYRRRLREYHYIPSISFGGYYTECFSHIPEELLK